VKAVVLARGRGTRMQARGRADATRERLSPEQAEAADAGLKAMIPLNGRPFLDYLLSALVDGGCPDICLVIGPEQEVIRERYKRISPPRRTRVTFAWQEQPRGTADALLAAEAFAGDDPFLALNADNYYPVGVYQALVMLPGQGLPAFSRDALVDDSQVDRGRVREYALLEIAPTRDLQDIIEKPAAEVYAQTEGRDAFVSMNLWRFGPSIFTACRRIETSPRGELELPSAVRFAIRIMGERFRTFPVWAGVLDLSYRGDILEVERRLASVDPQP
jgi:dTDP-glucose pyrophosphorylase